MQTVQIKLYKLSELSDKSKQKAIDNFRQNVDFYAQNVIDDAKHLASLFGLDIEKVFYSGFSSQGDGACFEGFYKYKPGALQAVKQYTPHDNVLHSIVKELQTAQSKRFYKLEAHTKHSGCYYHSYSMQIDVNHSDDACRDIGESESEIITTLRDFADWIYQQLEIEYNHQISDEYISETLIINDHLFTINGKMYK